jgi:CheY-like chemotaxis protein
VKILIVDDNEKMRNIIVELLKGDNHDIVELEDGEEAAKQYGSIKPDWVLMDIKLKKKNGFEASMIIKQNFPDARIAFVTKYDDKHYRRYAEKIGADAFISKQNLFELKKVIK